jgi:hypothetical protein
VQVVDREAKDSPLNFLDEQLSRILTRLAALLVRHGYGYQRVSRLTKAAYIRAAREISGRERPKISIARIAALTGLTRTEVSRLLKATQTSEASLATDLNRATRVAYGWVTNPKYCDERLRPRPLPFIGRSSFANLVRKYSGDIPVRAMLTEMKRLGMVEHGNDDVVRLVRQRPVPTRSTVNAVRAIAPWVDMLAKANNSHDEMNLTSTTKQVRIYLESQPQVLAAIRELENRRRSFVSSIEHLGANRQSSGKIEVVISLAVAAAQPKRIRRRKT